MYCVYDTLLKERDLNPKLKLEATKSSMHNGVFVDVN